MRDIVRGSCFLLLLTALLGCASTRADPQASVEPLSAPGAGQEMLARMVGDFDVDKTFVGRDGTERRSHGTCRQHMIEGGRFLQSDFTFAGENGGTTGLGIIGFDADTGRFTSFWIDSRSTRISIRHSTTPFDGKTIELVGTALQGDEPARPSHTSTHIDTDGRIVHRQMVPTQDGGERLLMQLVLTPRERSGT